MPQLRHLLTKYRANTLTPEEWNELKATAATHKAATQACLEELWTESSLQPPTARQAKELHQVWQNIQQNTRHQALRNTLRQLGKAAAILLTPLLLASSLYLYHDRKLLQHVAQQEIVIETGKGQRTHITLPDGSIAWLNAESSLRYPQNFGLNNRRVILRGEAWFEVQKQTQKKFTVQTDHLNIDVLGTSFNVCAYETQSYIETALVTGQVQVSTHTNPAQTMQALPNECIRYNKQSGQLEREKTDTRLHTAWTRNELVFRSEPLHQVFGKIEKHYGVRIVSENNHWKNDRFTGRFETSAINDIMHQLQQHYRFDYHIQGNEIHVVAPTSNKPTKTTTP